MTNRNQRKPFSAPNCSTKWIKTDDGRELLPKIDLKKTKRKKKSGGDDVKGEGRRRDGGRISRRDDIMTAEK